MGKGVGGGLALFWTSLVEIWTILTRILTILAILFTTLAPTETTIDHVINRVLWVFNRRKVIAVTVLVTTGSNLAMGGMGGVGNGTELIKSVLRWAKLINLVKS